MEEDLPFPTSRYVRRPSTAWSCACALPHGGRAALDIMVSASALNFVFVSALKFVWMLFSLSYILTSAFMLTLCVSALNFV